MALLPSDIKIDSGLSKALGQVGQAPMNSVQDVYGRMRARAAAEAGARGQSVSSSAGPGSYMDQRLGVGQNQAETGLRGGLEDVLGNTAYSDFKSDREYKQNMDLARQIGDLTRPSILQQVLGGLNGAAGAGGDFYGLYKQINKVPASGRAAPAPSYSDTGFSPNYVG